MGDTAAKWSSAGRIERLGAAALPIHGIADENRGLPKPAMRKVVRVTADNDPTAGKCGRTSSSGFGQTSRRPTRRLGSFDV